MSPLACWNKVDFDIVEVVGWYPYNFGDRIIMQVPAYEDVNCGEALFQAEEHVSYWNEFEKERTQIEIEELTVRLFNAKGSNLHWTPIKTNQRLY